MINIFELFKASFDKYLEGYLKHVYSYQPITDAYKYSISNGGKRLRPCLVYLGAYAVAPRNANYNPFDRPSSSDLQHWRETFW